jgi:hypothetical protein
MKMIFDMNRILIFHFLLFFFLLPSNNRYLSLTKSFYKELVTVFKDAATQEVKISGKAFEIESVNGLELFPASKKINESYSHLFVIVDPLKKNVVVMKNTFHNFW